MGGECALAGRGAWTVLELIAGGHTPNEPGRRSAVAPELDGGVAVKDTCHKGDGLGVVARYCEGRRSGAAGGRRCSSNSW